MTVRELLSVIGTGYDGWKIMYKDWEEEEEPFEIDGIEFFQKNKTIVIK